MRMESAGEEGTSVPALIYVKRVNGGSNGILWMNCQWRNITEKVIYYPAGGHWY
jgi:hypothetical protein